MGSSGMKRKGRQHLPKVGTPADREHVMHQSRRDVLDFGLGRGKGTRLAMVAVIVGLALIILAVLLVVLL